MADAVFAIPGDIGAATGGYEYARRLLQMLPEFGIAVSHLKLPGSFPAPAAKDLAQTKQLLSATPAGASLLIDGLAYGAMPTDLIAALERRTVALVHHPLYLETGLSKARSAELFESEKAALALAHHVVASSRTTQAILVKDFNVSAIRITVAEPGTDPAARASGTGTPMQLLAVGAISPRKGYDVLVRALEPLRHLDWRLTIAGALDRDPATAEALAQLIAERGPSDRIRLAGKVVPATLERFYSSADVFVMPSLFEGYGMVLAEAMARGLPIVCTTGGAAAETVPGAAAIKVAPGDVDALTQALHRALTDRKLRRRLADASWDAGRTLPTWNETARRVAAALMGMRA